MSYYLLRADLNVLFENPQFLYHSLVIQLLLSLSCWFIIYRLSSRIIYHKFLKKVLLNLEDQHHDFVQEFSLYYFLSLEDLSFIIFQLPKDHLSKSWMISLFQLKYFISAKICLHFYLTLIQFFNCFMFHFLVFKNIY